MRKQRTVRFPKDACAGAGSQSGLLGKYFSKYNITRRHGYGCSRVCHGLNRAIGRRHALLNARAEHNI